MCVYVCVCIHIVAFLCVPMYVGVCQCVYVYKCVCVGILMSETQECVFVYMHMYMHM